MKLISVIQKSLKEQIRKFWILILTISMAPFFVFVYYLILESEKPQYDILLLNQDNSIELSGDKINYAENILEYLKEQEVEGFDMPITIKPIQEKEEALRQLKNKKADALVVLPEDFTQKLYNIYTGTDSTGLELEFVGDLTNVNYMISAIWANELIDAFIYDASGRHRLLTIKETSLGISGGVDDFDLVVPGLIILSIIMLMFSASIAIITEVENQTILRLKLSDVTTLEFLSGISVVQVMVGIICVILTFGVAHALGFEAQGHFGVFFLIVVLTSISIIAFSLILAAFTKSANEILVIGNFPLFLFMFFTGAAFPIEGKALFHVVGYPISIQGLMSPTHAISALKKILIFDMPFQTILPEITALIVLTLLYFILGVWFFQRRHMRVQ